MILNFKSPLFIKSGLIGLILFTQGLSGCTTTPAPDVPVAQPKWVAFESTTYWNTNYGPMRIVLKGDQGEGVYPNYQGTLELTRKEKGVLVGYWFQPSAEKKCDTLRGDTAFWGTVQFIRISKGKIEGQWGYCDQPVGTGGVWRGVRIGHPAI